MEIIAWILGPLWAMVLSASTLALVRKNVEIERMLKRKPWLGTSHVVDESPRDRLKCGCNHHFAYHDRRTGRCEEQVGRSEFNQRQGRSETRYSRCRCRGYTGVVPPRADRPDDITTRLADGTVLNWSQPNPGAGTEVVQWTPSSRHSES
jgi:hypothetical protein